MYDCRTESDALPPHRSRFVTEKDEGMLEEIGEISSLPVREMNREVGGAEPEGRLRDSGCVE